MKTLQDTRHSNEIVQACIQAVCQVFDLTERELLSDGRSVRTVWPRQIAMAMARQRSGLTLQSISGRFRRQDHSTVMHAIKVVDDLREVSPFCKDQWREVNEAYDSIVNTVTSDIYLASTG